MHYFAKAEEIGLIVLNNLLQEHYAQTGTHIS